MSVLPDHDPACSTVASSASIIHVIDARPRDIGGFAVRRLLPSAARRLVGPFIFLDHMGPTSLAPGTGMDVRPHPHIGLATCSTARSCTATASGRSSPSVRARSIG